MILPMEPWWMEHYHKIQSPEKLSKMEMHQSDDRSTISNINPSVAEARILYVNWFCSMAADALSLCLVRPSAFTVL